MKHQDLLPIEVARWRLALVWFPACALLSFILILQTVFGAYGSLGQKAWSWALPNFLPTLALMLSVFGTDAIRTQVVEQMFVRKNFLNLSIGLSVFYFFALYTPVLAQPFLTTEDTATSFAETRLLLMETSNLWLGPLQGLVVGALGALFFMKESEAPTTLKSDEPSSTE